MLPDLARLLEAARQRASADPAHDWLHVQRVAASVRQIAAAEGGSIEVALPAALLHELFNHPKGHPESHLSGERCADEAEALLRAQDWEPSAIERIGYCIRVHSFSRGIFPETLEARILQDADRLDAIGAVGVARCFATCAEMKRPFYSAEDPFCRAREPNDKEWGLDHFYKKLLKISDGLHTATARAMAVERAAFMQSFLSQLEREL